MEHFNRDTTKSVAVENYDNQNIVSCINLPQKKNYFYFLKITALIEITDIPNDLWDCIYDRKNATEIEKETRKLEILLQNESSRKLIDAARNSFHILSDDDDNLVQFYNQLEISSEGNPSQEAEIMKTIDLVKKAYNIQSKLHGFDKNNLPSKYTGYGYSGCYVRHCWSKSELISSAKPEVFWKLFNCDVQLGVDVTLVYYFTCRYGGFSCIEVKIKFKVILSNF